MGWADGDELPVTTEIYVGGAGGWVDITDDTRLSSATSGGGITITRGRNAEGTVAAPGSASLAIDNRDGRYSPRNPRSPYYGRLGRNTPVRIGILLAEDGFDRTESDGWGTTDTGQAWDVSGGSSADFAVAAGTATIAHPTVNVIRWAHLASDLLDVEQVSDIATSAAATGGELVTGHIARYDSATATMYWFRLEFDRDATTITLRISKWVESFLTELASLAEVPGITYTPGQPLRLRTACVDGRLSMRVWDPGGPEPAAWHLTATDTDITAPGRAGIMTWVVGDNTNDPPLTASVSSYQAIDRRAVMEVPSWPPRWTAGGHDVWTPIEAAGIIRRLTQGARPLQSALRRKISATTGLVAYWPMEGGTAQTDAPSAIAGHRPLRPIATVEAHFGSVTGPDGSDVLPDLTSHGVLVAPVATYTDTGQWQVEFWFRTETGDSTDFTASVPVQWDTPAGSVVAWDVLLFVAAGANGPGVGAIGFDVSGYTAPSGGGEPSESDRLDVSDSVIVDSTPNVQGSWRQMRVCAEQSDPTTITFKVYLDDVLRGDIEISGHTLGPVTRVTVNPLQGRGAYAGVDGRGLSSVGHVAVYDSIANPETYLAGIGYAGETAGRRLIRLGEEQGVPLSVVGDPDATEAMGPQGMKPWYELVGECAAVDMGILYEARETLGLAYRTRASLYNPPAALEVDYGYLSPPLEPTGDDFAVSNDITVTRPAGGSAQAVLEVGPLSTQDPPDGVGVYDIQVPLNAERDDRLPDLAWWLLRQRTSPDERYPRVRVNLARDVWRSDPELTSRAAGLDSGRVLEVSGLPDWVPPGPIRLMAVGSTEVLDAYERHLTWVMEPDGPWHVWVVEDPVLGRIDTTLSALAADAVAADTTLLVATISPYRRWITTDERPQDLPMMASVGGLVVQVDAITGAASPQVFTLAAPLGVDLPAGVEVRISRTAVPA